MSTSTTPPEADLAAVSYRMVRTGVSAVLVAASALSLCVALFFAWNAVALGAVNGVVPDSWGAGLRAAPVWPVLAWSLAVGVGGLVAAALLRRCPDGRPDRLALILAVVHLGLAAAMVALMAYLWGTRGLEEARGNPVFLWALAMILVLVAGGVLLLMPQSRGPVALRLTLVAVGGVVGLVTLVLGLALPVTTYSSPLAQGLEQWRKEWDAVVWPAVAVFGSLVLMFVSLLLGKGLERQNQNIRRLIYGYNAAMTGLLLLAVLGLVNVLAYAEPFTRFFGRPFDWTAGNLNAVSPATRTLLANLQEPVTVISLLPQRTLVEADARTLLDNCKTLTPKFTWRHISREQENVGEITKLMEKYGISDPDGLLVLLGGGADKGEPTYSFINGRDMVSVPRREQRREAAGYEFTGEGALLNALRSLLEGKMTIYLTQGHGELSPDGGAAPPMQMGQQPPQGPLGTLRQKLTARRGVQVKTLALDSNTKAIPDDASVVMIVRPTRQFGKEELDALRKYLKRTRQTKTTTVKGKETEEESVAAGRLFLLAEPYIQKEGDAAKFVTTGLEELLSEYEVKLGMNRLISFPPSRPTTVSCESWLDPNTPASSNPIALAFAPRRDVEERIFPFTNVRTVEPMAPQGGNKLVERLFYVDWRRRVRVETDAARDPAAVIAAVRTRAQLLEAISRTDQTVAVAVSDRGAPSGAPRDSAHAGITRDTPRMVVFGTSSWVTNDGLTGGGAIRMDLVNNCISWLREKGTLGEGVSVDPKERKLYDLGIPPQNRTRLVLLPIALMLLGVMGLGLGVWVVRRR